MVASGNGALWDALDALATNVTAIVSPLATSMIDPVSGASVTDSVQVMVGDPIGVDIAQIIAAKKSQITVWPTGSSTDVTKYQGAWRPVKAASPLIATVVIGTPSTITLSGAVIAGINIHTHVGKPYALKDAYYQSAGTGATIVDGGVALGDFDGSIFVASSSSDTLITIAAAIAAQINALALPGISATASGAVVTVTGARAIICDIGAVGVLQREIGRTDEQVQVAVWSPYPHWRAKYAAAIKNAIGCKGSPDNQYYAYGDGSTTAWIRYGGGAWRDSSQSDYGAYEARLVFMVEYPEVQRIAGYPIGAIQPTLDLPGGTLLEDIG